MAENTTLNNDPEMEKLTKQVAKGGGITLFGSIIEKGFTFITVLILARILGAESLGLYFLGMAILNMLVMVSTLGLNIGSVKFISIYFNKKNKGKIKGVIYQSFSVSLILGCIIAIILYLSSEYLARIIFEKERLNYVIKLFSLAIPIFSTFRVTIMIPRGFKIMKYFVYSKNIFIPFMNLLLIIGFFSIGFLIDGAIYARIFSYIGGLFLAIYYIYKVFPDLLNNKIQPDIDKSLISYSIPLMGTNFIQSFILWTDVLMLGYFLLSSDVGIYRTAAQVALFLLLFAGAFNSIFSPLIAELYNLKKISRLDQIYQLTTKWIIYISIPFLIIIVFASKEILLVFGEEFVGGGGILIVLAFTQFVNTSTSTARVILMMAGREKLEFVNTFIIAILNIVLNIILIPSYGIVGAAMATGISIILVSILRLLEVKKIIQIFPYNIKYLKGLTSGFFAIGILIPVKYLMGDLHYILMILLVIVLTITIFVASLNVLKFDKEDDLILKSIIKKFEMRNYLKKA